MQKGFKMWNELNKLKKSVSVSLSIEPIDFQMTGNEYAAFFFFFRLLRGNFTRNEKNMYAHFFVTNI